MRARGQDVIDQSDYARGGIDEGLVDRVVFQQFVNPRAQFCGVRRIGALPLYNQLPNIDLNASSENPKHLNQPIVIHRVRLDFGWGHRYQSGNRQPPFVQRVDSLPHFLARSFDGASLGPTRAAPDGP